MKTFIYSITNKLTNQIYYVGSTTRKYFCQRKDEHLKHIGINREKYTKSWLNIHDEVEKNGGWDNFIFSILFESDAMEKLDRRKKEQEFIISHKPLYNKQNAYTSIEVRKEQKRNNAKQFRINNPNYDDKYKEQKKAYEKKRCQTKIDCECGGKYTKQNKTNHFKSAIHQKMITN